MFLHKPINAPLHVVAVISNPVRYRSRYAHYLNFAKHVEDAGAVLWTVEMAFGEREHEITVPSHARHIQVRGSHELWNKENLINIGLSRLPSDWKYAAWIDADVHFVHPHWVQETLHQLQHYPVVQMFAEAHDLGPDGLLFNRYRSFGWSHVHNIPRHPGMGVYGGTPQKPDQGIAYWHHPGFAWAARRDALDQLGGLFDFAVVGEGDHIMARCIVGEAHHSVYPGVSEGYHKSILEWQHRARTHLRGNLGYVPGTLLHYWHGKKRQRNYWNRCKILKETQFDPNRHIKRDSQGLWQLVDCGDDASIVLRDRLREYFRSRNEDSLDL